ncbi:MAG: prolyl oligopeptidase family serine peptidase [Clostridia bacterium]|nr:prolyl oligopeptidase family serine peptidase [Clostridia bacterium]
MGNLYYQVIRVTDFGPYVTKLVLCMPRETAAEELKPEAFSVYVEVLGKDGRIVELPKSFIERDQFIPSRGYRPVTAAYPSDLHGNAVTGKSRFVALEMPYGPIWKCCSALAADFKNINGHESYTVRNYRITLTAPLGEGDDAMDGLVFDMPAGEFNPQAARFLTGISSHPDLPLRYGYFVPKRLDGKKALIIFLHGAGEGGQDLPIAWSGNKVTELTEDWVQAKFGGAFVLVPQCDTMWLDDGSGKYGDSGKSKYTAALKALIDEFIARFPAVIDPDRVYVGGDSNGGFMTMRMLMSYPDFFAAAFPICEAMLDKRISEEDIRHLKEIPIWFTHAKNDPVVKPEDYVVPTYRRLMAAGAKNCHFTFWDKIVDMHGLFRNEKGEPWEYMGHFSWIPMLNDDCKADYDGKPVVWEGREVTLMDWLAAQKRNR